MLTTLSILLLYLSFSYSCLCPGQVSECDNQVSEEEQTEIESKQGRDEGVWVGSCFKWDRSPNFLAVQLSLSVKMNIARVKEKQSFMHA